MLARLRRRRQPRQAQQRQRGDEGPRRRQAVVPRHVAGSQQQAAHHRRNHRAQTHGEHGDRSRLHQVLAPDQRGRCRQQRRHAQRGEETVPQPQGINREQRRLRQHRVQTQPNKAHAAGAARQQDQLFTLVAVRQHAADHQADEHRPAG